MLTRTKIFVLSIIVQCAIAAARSVHAQVQLRAEAEVGDATVLIADVSEIEDAPAPSRAFEDQGFAVLRPALPDDPIGHEELKVAVENMRASQAVELLGSHEEFRAALNFRWFLCGVPVISEAGPDLLEGVAASKLDSPDVHVAPDAAPTKKASSTEEEIEVDLAALAASFLRSLLTNLPSLALPFVQPVKIWLPLRVPVQPLAIATSSGSGQQNWWWAGEDFRLGDAIVINEFRCPHSSFTLPGEAQLVRSLLVLRRLRESLIEASRSGSLQNAARECADIESVVLEPFPFPVVGKRYTVYTEPSALVRREASVESEVAAEVPPGGILTVLAVDSDGGFGRVKVYTEHATELSHATALQDGGDLPGGASQGPEGGVIGWMTSSEPSGHRVLQEIASPADEGSEMPDIIQERLRDLGTVLSGTCAWVNFTADASRETPANASVALHRAHILNRYVQDLMHRDSDARCVAIEAQCAAIAPLSTTTWAALGATILAVGVGTVAICGGLCGDAGFQSGF